MTGTIFGSRYRNWPDAADTMATAAGRRRHVSELMMPALTLQASALEHNAALMARWVAGLGFDLAPHGKTTMSPELIALQLRHGAWAITAATAGQARMFADWGVPRIVLANEVTDPGGLRWVAETVAAGDVSLLVLVDSVPGVELLAAAARSAGSARPVDVLLEWGIPGGRAGVRTLAEARHVAEAVGASPLVRLAGVECFEGVAGHDRSASDEAAVEAMVADLVTLLGELGATGAFGAVDEVVLTAGGSSYPDLVAAAFARITDVGGLPVRRVLRSGGYLTHDHGMLDRTSPMRESALPSRRNPAAGAAPVRQRGVHARAGVGDSRVRQARCTVRHRPADPARRTSTHRTARRGHRALPGVRVLRCNDQHAFVEHAGELAVGDQVVFGLSHPCTAFDKWSLVPVLDDEEHVIDLVTTQF